jgi:anti-sigma B factor antagonist
MNFERTQNGQEISLTIAGALDALTAPQLRSEVESLASLRQATIVIDLSGLEFIDSSGVAVLVSLYKRVRSLQGSVSVVGVRDQPLAIFRLLHLDRVFCR